MTEPLMPGMPAPYVPGSAEDSIARTLRFLDLCLRWRSGSSYSLN